MTHSENFIQNKPVLTAGLMTIITVGLIVLEIYVDIHTGIENATTEYQKFVMGWMGFFLGAFSAISVMASGALKQMNKQTAFNALAFLSLLLAIYSLLVWISFFCTMWVDYSTTKIESSIEHRAKVLTVKALENASSSIDANQASSAHVTELNQTATAEDLAVKNCSKLKSWRKVRDCKNEHGAKFDAVNRELSEINSARESNKNRIDDLKSISGNDADNSLTDFVMMPLAAMITESKESGKNLMLSVAVLITVIVSYITNCGLYFVGSLIGGDYLKRQQLSPAPLNLNSEESRLWNNQKPENTEAEKEQPQSWSDRYKAGEVSAWSGIFGGRDQQPAAASTVAYSINTPATMQANTDTPRLKPVVSLVKNTDTDAGLNYGVSELREYADTPVNSVINTQSPTLLDGVGFGAREIPNPNYQRPVIYWPEQNAKGVEIELSEPEQIRPAVFEAIENTRDCIQIDTPADTDTAVNTVADTVKKPVSLVKKHKEQVRGDAGVFADTLVRNGIADNSFFAVSDAVGVRSIMRFCKSRNSGIGQVVAKRIYDKLIEDKLIDVTGNKIQAG